MLKNILIVGLGGFAGSIIRYLTILFVDRKLPTLYPWGTFAVNILGCLLVGVIYGYSLKSAGISNPMRILLVIGFCGSFTTFSTFANESFELFGQKASPVALLYIVASIITGLLAVYIGQALGKVI